MEDKRYVLSGKHLSTDYKLYLVLQKSAFYKCCVMLFNDWGFQEYVV